ncbi:hypothetical protein NQ317_004115 [Molorchus minor]|uniref:CCHC-type domain-containing protein n=1 Tax=Molorchus minor TaxID=1323400 RepID=A0ABQ9J573_9CUCU|nr:hypothetical protein NQ317_004115 [Molorchus minor]
MATPIQRRGALKTKLTNFAKVVGELGGKSTVSELDIIQLQARLDHILKLEDEFDLIQTKIEGDQQSEEEREQQILERDEFETRFYEQTSLAKMLISVNSHQTAQSGAGSNSSGDAIEIQPSNNTGIRLPKIELPKFSGEYSGWLEFRDTFESMIHNNNSISDVQKFHYLRSCLIGDAVNVISSLEFSLHNYIVAWNALLDRYDNRNLLVHNHIKALFNIESSSKASSTGLRQIVDSVSKHMRALQQLKEPTENWDTPIVYVVSTKLDNVTLSEWEKYKKDKDKHTLDVLKTFLKSQADLLETLELRKQEKVADKEREKREFGSKPSSKQSRATENGGQTNKFSAKCRFCLKQHYIQNCSEFLTLSPDEKCEKLRKLRLCTNCMRPGHSNEACRRGTCQKCNEKHHTLLHKFPSTENLTSANISSVVLTASTNKSERSEYVMLSTAYADIRHAGSQSNYITQELCEKLSLNTSEQEMIIAGLNNSVSKDFYVDDCLTGSDQLENAALIIRGVADILKQGHLVLRKFYSNNPEVLKYVSDENTPANLVEFGENENAKTLGLSWCPTSDKLLYKINIAPAKQKYFQIFDPLGLLSPCVITVKILLQQLWLEKLSWDEGLPSSIHTFWRDFECELTELNCLRINRHVIGDNYKRVDVHAFSDARRKRTGHVSIDADEKISVNLLCAKTKVAPLKPLPCLG